MISNILKAVGVDNHYHSPTSANVAGAAVDDGVASANGSSSRGVSVDSVSGYDGNATSPVGGEGLGAGIATTFQGLGYWIGSGFQEAFQNNGSHGSNDGSGGTAGGGGKHGRYGRGTGGRYGGRGYYTTMMGNNKVHAADALRVNGYQNQHQHRQNQHQQQQMMQQMRNPSYPHYSQPQQQHYQKCHQQQQHSNTESDTHTFVSNRKSKATKNAANSTGSNPIIIAKSSNNFNFNQLYTPYKLNNMPPMINRIYNGRKMVPNINHLYEVVDDKEAYLNYDQIMMSYYPTTNTHDDDDHDDDHCSDDGSSSTLNGSGSIGRNTVCRRMMEEELVDRMLSQFPVSLTVTGVVSYRLQRKPFITHHVLRVFAFDCMCRAQFCLND